MRPTYTALVNTLRKARAGRRTSSLDAKLALAIVLDRIGVE